MIDAHAHLWLKQNGVVDGLPVYDVGGGRSRFGREIRQMLPPAMTDGINSAERRQHAENHDRFPGFHRFLLKGWHADDIISTRARAAGVFSNRKPRKGKPS